MKIDSLSQEQWNTQKNTVTTQRDKLVKDNKNGKNDDRIKSLNGTLNNMSTLENSNQVYSLQSVNGNAGQLRLDIATGNIVIEYFSTANFVHEVTHGAQFESGNIGFGFDPKTQNTWAVANDLWDEVAAYQAQFNYSPSSVGGARKVDQINFQWVSNITDAKGNKPYGPGGEFKVGQHPLNANSTMLSVYIAYPHSREQIIRSRDMFKGIPLKNYKNYYFK
jgi:hypothetical protein